VRVRPAGDGGWEAEPLLGKSGALATLVFADGVVRIPESLQGLEAGAEVEVELFGRV